MALTRLEPFSGFDRMFDLMYGRGDRQRSMPIDIYRNGNEYTVEMDLPGADPDSIDVGIERNMLTVTAEARSHHEQAEEQVVCERSHARFSRQLYLGENLDLDNVKAKFENGVLRITVPAREQQGGRKIAVTTGGNGERAIETQSNEARNQSG